MRSPLIWIASAGLLLVPTVWAGWSGYQDFRASQVVYAQAEADAKALHDGLAKLQEIADEARRSRAITASWYAKGLPHGGLDFTAASRDHARGTRLHLEAANGRRCWVRVNDFGPEDPERGLDLSLGAARRLGFVHAGLAQVRILEIHLPSVSTGVQ